MATMVSEKTVPAPERALGRTMGRNTLFGVGEKCYRMVAKLAMVPVSLHFIGVTGFGIWDGVVSVMAYMTLGVGGAGSAYQKYVAEAAVTGDYDRASRRLSVGAAMMLVLGLLVLIPAALYAHQIAALMDIGASKAGRVIDPLDAARYRADFVTAVRLLALTLLFTNFGMIFGSIVMGVHRIDLTRMVDAACTTIEIALGLILFFLGYGLLALVVALAAAELARTTLYFILSRRIVPQVRISPFLISRDVIGETLRFAGGYQLFNYIQATYNSLLPLLILKFLGGEVNGVFGVSRRFISFPVILAESALLPLLSGATLVYARQEWDRFRELFVKVVKFTVVVLAPPVVFLAVFSRPLFLALSPARANMVATPADVRFVMLGMALLGVAILWSSIARVYAAMYRASGGLIGDIYWMLVKLALLVPLMLYGIHTSGYHGALLGFLAAELVGLVFIHTRLEKHIPWSDFAASLLRAALVVAGSLAAAGVCFAMYWVPLAWITEPRLEALVRIMLLGVVYGALGGALLCYSGFLSRDEKDLVLSFIPGVRRRETAA